jgi:kinesin family protein 6/9
LVKKYEQEIKELKSELSMHDAMANRGHVQYDSYTDEQRYDLSQTVKKFLHSQIEEIEVESLRQVKEIFGQFKIILNNMESELEQRSKQQTAASQKVKPGTPKEEHKKNWEDEGVGEMEFSGGFGIGTVSKNSVNFNLVKAPASAKPLNSPSRQKKKRNKLKELDKGESKPTPTKVL